MRSFSKVAKIMTILLFIINVFTIINLVLTITSKSNIVMGICLCVSFLLIFGLYIFMNIQKSYMNADDDEDEDSDFIYDEENH